MKPGPLKPLCFSFTFAFNVHYNKHVNKQRPTGRRTEQDYNITQTYVDPSLIQLQSTRCIEKRWRIARQRDCTLYRLCHYVYNTSPATAVKHIQNQLYPHRNCLHIENLTSCLHLCVEEEEEEDRSQHDRRTDQLHPPHTHRLWRDGRGTATGESPHLINYLPDYLITCSTGFFISFTRPGDSSRL